MNTNSCTNRPRVKRKGVINYFKSLSPEIQGYFKKLEILLRDYPTEISLSYVFSLIEKARHMALYCGIIKKHHTNKELTDKAIQSYHIIRDDYKVKFKNIFSDDIEPGALGKLEAAEKIRDKIMHGKKTTDSEKLQAIKDALEFSHLFNEQIYQKAAFRPFGSLKGFKGARKSLGIDTSKWILKGLGFNLN